MSCRWGPNHAADPIVTRWQRGEDGQVVSDKGTGKQVNKQNICLVAYFHLKSRCSSLLPSRGKIQELGLFQGAWSTQERRYLRVKYASTFICICKCMLKGERDCEKRVHGGGS